MKSAALPHLGSASSVETSLAEAHAHTSVRCTGHGGAVSA